MVLTITPGDVFHVPLPRKDFCHIHIIITSVDQNTGAFLCVPVDSWENQRLSDPTVILNVGDHKFITKKSYINYDEAKILNYDQISLWFMDGSAKKFDPLDQDLFEKVRLGVKKSIHTNDRCREFYDYFLYK